MLGESGDERGHCHVALSAVELQKSDIRVA
jgi:hypothetical protein